MVASIGVVLIVAFAAALLVRYIRLLRLSARVEEAWGDLKLLLARRAELVPAIANTAEQYVRGERDMYKRLVDAQRQASRVSGVGARAAAEADLQVSLRAILEVVESYPQLKAHDGMRYLRGELLDVEVRLRRAVEVYNKTVTLFNHGRRLPHARLAAGLAGMRQEREMFGMAAGPLRLLQ